MQAFPHEQGLNFKMLKVLLLAILLDLFIGDPPNRWHTVAWMGRFISKLRKRAPQKGKFLYGGWITVGGGLLVWLLSTLVLKFCLRLPSPFSEFAQAWILKTTFSIRGLDNAAHEVEIALNNNDLAEARRVLSWHLVSRDTSTLTESQVSAAAIESVAENTSDGIIAPLFWYRVGGLSGAMTYRYLQTCDSILGYRDEEREWLGKIPARTDDLLNLIPARVTALLFVACRLHAWKIWRHDANVTASPNAGHPMSAMAGALDVELEKVDHYRLNAGARPPQINDIHQSRNLMLFAVAVFTVLMMLLTKYHDD